MDDFNVPLIFLFIVLGGAFVGLIFNFLKGESLRNCLGNVTLGIMGSSVGAIVAVNLPIVASNRWQVILSMSYLVTFYFMVGHWMISKKTTPVVKAVNSYRETPAELDEQRVQSDESHPLPDRPAA